MNPDKKYQDAIDYTISVLISDVDCFNGPIQKRIVYSDEISQQEGPCVQILPSGFFSDRIYGTSESLPELPLKNVCDIPILYGTTEIRRREDRLIVHSDIIASAYYLLTRYEEVIRPDVRDRFGRFPGKQSLPCRAGFIDRPIVDEYALLLRKWLREVGLDVSEPRRNFSVLLTHDVDYLYKYRKLSDALRNLASCLIGRRLRQNIFEGFRALRKTIKDPYDTFDEIIKLDESIQTSSNNASFKTAYFFLAGDKNQPDISYDIQSIEVKNIIAKVHSSGAMIGLHTSFACENNPENIAYEKTKLEEACGFPITMNRYHYLDWCKIRNGWALVEAGLKWDSTLGYADVAGFRLGVCRPVPLFDPIRMQAFGIEEHPLIVMDVTLDSTDYMNLNEDQALEYCKRLIEQIHKHNGEFVILLHNNRFINYPHNYFPRLYRRLLNELIKIFQSSQ
jgi:hypothetical protein